MERFKVWHEYVFSLIQGMGNIGSTQHAICPPKTWHPNASQKLDETDILQKPTKIKWDYFHVGDGEISQSAYNPV